MREWTSGVLMPIFSLIGIYHRPFGLKSRQKMPKMQYLPHLKDWELMYPPPFKSGPNLAQQNGPTVYFTTPNLTVIGIYRRPFGLKNHQKATKSRDIYKIVMFGGSCTIRPQSWACLA